MDEQAKINKDTVTKFKVVDGPYNKDSTVKTSGSRGVYNKFHAHF
jgi:hypothetical protein